MNRDELIQASIRDLQQRLKPVEKAVGRLQRMETANSIEQVLSVFLTMPGLRGLWPFTSMGDGGAGIDISGQGRTLTNNNDVLFAANDAIGYADFTAADLHYFSRADEAGLSIAGDEAYVDPAIQGITVGGWFWFNAVGVTYGLMSKYVTGGQASYRMRRDSDNEVYFLVSGDGSGETGTSSFDAPLTTAGAWFFCVGRAVNGTTITVFLNGIENEGGAAPPSPIFDSTSPFEIGRMNAGSYLDGRAALCFVCAAAVPNNILEAAFEQSRGFFGV